MFPNWRTLALEVDCSLLWGLSRIGQGCIVYNPRQQSNDAPCGHCVANSFFCKSLEIKLPKLRINF